MATLRSLDYLPSIFRTDTNRKVLGSTLDKLTTEPQLQKISAFVGRTFTPTWKQGDGYIVETTTDRANYQLEPSLVITDSTTGLVSSVTTYPDLINKLANYNVPVNNHSRLFENEYYNFNPLIDEDKFINFFQYYWVPEGPPVVNVSTVTIPLNETFLVSSNNQANYVQFDQAGNDANPTLNLSRGGTYSFVLNTNVENFWIQTQPGLSGFNTVLTTVPTRQIDGVSNNGASSLQTVTFTVPQSDAQDGYINMPLAATINIASDLTYAQIADMPLNGIISNYDGIDGLRYINNKIIIFSNQSNSNSDWTSSQTHTVVPMTERFGTWLLTIDTNNYIRLSPLSSVPVGQKVHVLEGDAYANREFARSTNYDNSFELIPVITANLQTLYYQTTNNANQFGVINIVNTPTSSVIDVTTEILGRTTYTSPDGVQFTNGLKIIFGDDVTPSNYQFNAYYVEGVGQSIELVQVNTLVTPEPYANTAIGLTEPDYLTMQRSSEDRNPWARSNRWFHIDVLQSAANYNSTSLVLDPTKRAIRPIIEFEKNYQLINTGASFFDVVNLIDFSVTDPFSQVEGKQGFYVDQVKLTNGVKVIFAGATNPTVRQTVYEAQLITVTAGANPQLNLTPLEVAQENQNIIISEGTKYTGVSMNFNGNDWVTNQEKFSVNQPILFDMFDTAGNSFTEQTLYPGTTFIGTKIFGYTIGTGSPDSVLGFPITYRTFNNVGDIQFTNFFDTDVFSYLSNGLTVTKNINIGFLHKTDSSAALGYDLRNVWSTASEESKQYQHFTYTYTSGATQFLIDVTPETSTLVENILLYVNDLYVENDLYAIEQLDIGLYVVMNVTLNPGDKVDIFIYSQESTSIGYYEIPDNLEDNAQNATIDTVTLGQYRSHISEQFISATQSLGIIPGLAVANYLPAIVDTSDTTQITADTAGVTADNVSQFASQKTNVFAFSENTQNQILTSDTTLFDADTTLYSGDNVSSPNLTYGGTGVETQNLRDFPNIYKYKGKIIQNSAGLQYAELFLLNNNYNFINAIRQARYEYNTFKTKFLQAAITISDIDQLATPAAVDAIMKYINANKDISFPYYYSDMIPYGSTGVTTTYNVANPTQLNYNISAIFDPTELSNRAVLVYHNGVQLTRGLNYQFSTTNAVIEFINTTFAAGDVISIVDYSSTDGSLVPETPTKLGLYPAFIPQIVLDNTYQTPMDVIIGHDGSYTPAFGDFRDDLLLELELRIYNNIKTTYTDKLDVNSIIPGKFRTTDYSISEINQILSGEFLTWAGINKVDYSDNNWFQSNNAFTWNYSSFEDKDNQQLHGYWRGIYEYFYDTTHPDTRPWEMLGFSQIPDWWISQYGPAPYTKGNTLLWQDLEAGYVGGGNNIGINLLYARPGLSNYIPVDLAGNLLPPTQVVTKNFDSSLADANYEFGDVAPPEYAWRSSSEYPFSIQILEALAKPAKYFGLLIDNGYQKNASLNQFLFTDNERFKQTDTSFNGTTVNNLIVRQASYTNWVADYIRTQGINPSTTLLSDITAMTIQLAYKMGAFTDQNYLNVILEQNTPATTTQGILVPVDNYSVSLIKSAPVTTATYSAVIVELTSGGYSVRGYDATTPYFNIVPSVSSSNAVTISQAGATATIYQDYTPVLMSVVYGSTFTTKQQLVDFLVSYQRYLNAVGFNFSDRSSALNQQQDWYLSSNEFLAWSQQGWDVGAAIVLSPVANKLQLLSALSVADSLQDNAFGARILDLNFNVIDNTRYTVLRDSSATPNIFAVEVVDGTTIGLMTINLVQWEHVLVFDNITSFNDIIYQPATSDRQYRVKLNGYKTTAWNGSMSTPGFFINQNNVQTWDPNTTYNTNDLVSFKGVYYTAKQIVYPSSTFNFTVWQQIDSSVIKTGLIPNFANTAQQYQNFYNVDYVNFNDQADAHAKGLIGFRPRTYLTDLDVESSSQIKFYQGFIKQKGTTTAVDAFTRANFGNLSSNVELFEEWAIRVGSFGATETKLDVEVQLDSATFTGNPQIIEFNPTVIDTSNSVVPAVSYAPSQLYSAPLSWDSSPFITGPGIPIEQQLPTAGYVRPSDVDAVVFDITDIATIDNVIPNIGSGYTIWTAKDFTNDWNVYRVSETGVTCETVSNALDGLIQLSFAQYHQFTVGQIIALKNFSSAFDGFYQVLQVVDLQNILVAYSANLSGFVQATGTGLVFTLQSIRFTVASDMSTFTPINAWLDGDMTWIDNYQDLGEWAVLQKNSPFDFTNYLSRFTTNIGANFGTAIAASSSNSFVLVGAPGLGFNANGGTLSLFVKSSNGTLVPAQELEITSTQIANLGQTAINTPIGWIASAPGSRSGTGYVYTGIIKNAGFVITQTIVAPDFGVLSNFGGSLCATADGSYLFISAPKVNEVYAYGLVQGAAYNQITLTADSVTATFALGFTPLSINSLNVLDNSGLIAYVPNIDYTISGSNIVFNVAPTTNVIVTQPTQFYNYISTITASDSALNDEFGFDITCNAAGNRLYVSAPNNVGNANEFKAGAVYCFARSGQQFVMDGATTVVVPTLPISNNVTVTIDGVYQPSNIFNPNTYNVIINTSNNTIVFLNAPAAGSIVKVVYGNFNQIQKLGGNTTQQTVNFGQSIAYDDLSGNLLVGAPNETDESIYYSGAVYRFIDAGSSTGTLTSVINPTLIAGDVIAINSFYVTVTNATLNGFASNINSAKITGITASVLNNALVITSSSSATANRLAISPVLGNTYKNLGFVPIQQTQQIINPIATSNARFGYAVAIQDGGTEMMVGSPFASTYEDTTFDSASTTFDRTTTHFVDAIPSGSVFVFELQPDIDGSNLGQYVEVQQLVSGKQVSGDLFGTAIDSSGTDIFVGSPNAFDRNPQAGTVQQYVNSSGTLGWEILRTQSSPIIPNPVNKMFVYSKQTNTILQNIETVDPLFGMIPGEAKQNIDFFTSVDPAVYEVVQNAESGLILNPLAPWGKDQIGLVWWNLDTVRFVDYKQGDLAYRAANWASLMPGSSVDVYEWVSTIYLPSQYVTQVGDGVPKHADDSVYCSQITYDSITGNQVITYYYWIKNKTSINVTSPKTLPVNSVAQIISNPQAQGIEFAAILDTNALALYNVISNVSSNDTILHINYNNSVSDNLIHNEYQLVQNGNVNSKIPPQIISKLTDSLVGVDKLGNTVPDSSLPVSEQYGTALRPIQSMVIDRLTGLEVLIQYVNSVCSVNQIAFSKDLSVIQQFDPIPPAISNNGTINYNQTVANYETLTFLPVAALAPGYKVLVANDFNFNGFWAIYSKTQSNVWVAIQMQSYDTRQYWQYVTWYSPEYNPAYTPDFVVDTLVDIAFLTNVQPGNIIKINDNGSGDSEIVLFNSIGNYTTLALDNATIQFDSSLYDFVDNQLGWDNQRFDVQPFDKFPVQETRNIINCIFNNIFIDDLAINANSLFFRMINYILSEQKWVDWIFKTSFVSVLHQIRELSQVPSYQIDNQTYFQDYLNEVLPYHTIIRDYVLDYTWQDTYLGDVTDFDLPPYFDSSLGYYRSPNGTQPNDQFLLDTQPQYEMWNNYHLSNNLISIELSNGGSGFISTPTVYVTGGGGTGATAIAIMNGSTVASIEILSEGVNYVTAPIVTISGGGGIGATAVAIIGNNLIRSFDLTMKFDRISYNTNVVPWTPNTTFTTNQIVTYNGLSYGINVNFTGSVDDILVSDDTTLISVDETAGIFVSGSTFDTTNLFLMSDSDYTNANDRIAALYDPSSGMPGDFLNQVQSGIDYSGVKMTGLTFEQTPVWDVGGFDTEPFDATQIGPEGFPIPSDSLYDVEVSSLYTDLELGIRPADIIVDGGAYIDAFASYAPEELVPGSVFDTLDFKVVTNDPTINSTNPKGVPVELFSYPGTGFTQTYSYSATNLLGDNVLVFTKNGGMQIPNVNYTMSFNSKTITFKFPPASSDYVYLYVIDDAGGNQIFAESFILSGNTNLITLNAPYAEVMDSLVLFNGLTTNAYTLSLAPDGRNTLLTITAAALNGLNVHVHLYSTYLTRAEVHVQEVVIAGPITSSSYIINMDRTIFNAGPIGGAIIVNHNDNRLIPTNTAYYTGDGVTTVFASQGTQNINPATVQPGDFDVWINNVPYFSSSYTILPPSGTIPRQIQFNTAPPVGAQISVGVNTGAQYVMTGGSPIGNNQFTINSSEVTLLPGDIISIISVQCDDLESIRTQVYQGGQIIGASTLNGFSAAPYDTAGFDAPSTIELIVPNYTLSRPAANLNYLIITFNGRRLIPYNDFSLLTPTVVTLSSTLNVQQSDIVVITSLTEVVQQSAIGFRMFKDMRDNWSYLRLSQANTTTLVQALHITDTEIFVKDVSTLGIPNPEQVIPGVIFIGGERITYWQIDTVNNALLQIRRGTAGTGATQATIPVGTLVEDASMGQEIPNAAGMTWYTLGATTPSNGQSLVNDDTIQAIFLKEQPTFYIG